MLRSTLVTMSPLLLFFGLVGGVSIVPMYDTVEHTKLDPAQQCASNITEEIRPEKDGVKGMVDVTLLMEPVSFWSTGEEDVLAHERTHMFQACALKGPVLAEEQHLRMEFHPSVMSYALAGKGLSSLRMENEAFRVMETCAPEWNKMYLSWKAGDTSTQEATSFITNCILEY